MKERLQKILSARGLASRRKAEEWIKEGRVACNGIVAALGDIADPDVDRITVDGKPLPEMREHVYLMLHKPRGYVTTLSDEMGRQNAAQLVEDCGIRVYPVGRLDMDSEGLLLFTNDGEFANTLMHPKHEVKKTYHAHVRGFTMQGLERLGRPMTLDGYKLRIPDVRLLGEGKEGTALLEITIHEGRNRQVRRMCEIADMRVTRLIRVKEGSLALGNLPLGKWRHLTADEVQKLKGE